MMMMSCMEVCNNTHTKTMVIVQLRFQWSSRQKKQPCTYIIRTVCMHVLHTHTQSRTQRHILHAHTIFTHHHKITWSLFIVKPRITWAGCHCNNTRIGKKRKLKRTNRIKIAIVHIAIYWLCCFALLCFVLFGWCHTFFLSVSLLPLLLRLLLPCALHSFPHIVYFIWFRLLCVRKFIT